MRVLFALLALAAIVSVSAQGLTGPNFYIIGAVPNTDYRLDLLNGTILPDPTLTLTVGTTYKFIINASMNDHPFGFSADNTDTITMGNLTGAAQGGLTSSGSCAAGRNSNPLSWITTDTANPCILSITPPATAVGIPIYYRCSVHSAMFGTLNIVAAAGTTTNPPTGTTSPPTGTTTQPPTGTTQPPTSTGKNSAAIIVPGAAAVIIAAINVIFSA